jgi:hypothetical protein
MKTNMSTNLSQKSQRVYDRLVQKSEASFSDGVRMPSLASVNELLNELGIKHSFRASRNMVEFRSRGSKYVNSRHEGKNGYKLSVGNLDIDSSESYYSDNSWNYARQLVALLNNN